MPSQGAPASPTLARTNSWDDSKYRSRRRSFSETDTTSNRDAIAAAKQSTGGQHEPLSPRPSLPDGDIPAPSDSDDAAAVAEDGTGALTTHMHHTRTELDGVHITNFIESRCKPECPPVVIDAVVCKLTEQLQRVDLGPVERTPSQLTVEAIVDSVLSFNGVLVQGAYFDAIDMAVDRICAAVSDADAQR